MVDRFCQEGFSPSVFYLVRVALNASPVCLNDWCSTGTGGILNEHYFIQTETTKRIEKLAVRRFDGVCMAVKLKQRARRAWWVKMAVPQPA